MISKQINMGDVVAVCYRLLDQEEVHEAYTFQTHMTEEQVMGDDQLDSMHTKQEKLVGDVKVRDKRNCSDHKLVVFSILRGPNKANSKITGLDFRLADFSLCRNVLGRIPKDMALERTDFQRSLPSNLRMLYPSWHEIKQRWQ